MEAILYVSKLHVDRQRQSVMTGFIIDGLESLRWFHSAIRHSNLTTEATGKVSPHRHPGGILCLMLSYIIGKLSSRYH